MQKKTAQQQERQKQMQIQLLNRKIQTLRSTPKGVETDITAGYEPQGELIDERRREDKGKPRPAEPSAAFKAVSAIMGSGRAGVQPRGKKKVPGKKPPVAGQYGAPASPAQKIAKRRRAAAAAQAAMSSRFD
jgi:hypothetical protein